MPDNDTPQGATYSIGELAELGGVSRRTVRYYVQRGLIPAPSGAGRGSRYPAHALNRLLEVKRLQERGVSLAGIEAHLTQPQTPNAPPPTQKTTVTTVTIEPTLAPVQELWTRVTLEEGVELHLRQRRLSSDQLEQLQAAVSAILSPDGSATRRPHASREGGSS